MRRVAVTGLGAITPIGLDAPSTWRAAVAGESGVDFIQTFDASEFPVRIAGEVKGFDSTSVAPHKEARRMDRNVLLALGAAQEAWRDSGINGLDPARVGIVVGSAIGGATVLLELRLELSSRRTNAAGRRSLRRTAGGIFIAENLATRGDADALNGHRGRVR